MTTQPESLASWLDAHPPPDDAFTQTIAGVARRVLGGEPFLIAARDLIDEYRFRPTWLQTAALDDEPDATGQLRFDAFLAALAEHLAVNSGFTPPAWTGAHGRELERFWFVSEIPGFRAMAIVGSPAAFRRRGIFVSPGALQTC